MGNSEHDSQSHTEEVFHFTVANDGDEPKLVYLTAEGFPPDGPGPLIRTR